MASTYGSFARAETAADEQASLRTGKWAVVEDFYSGYFLVLPLAEAEDYTANNDAGIQYETGAESEPEQVIAETPIEAFEPAIAEMARERFATPVLDKMTGKINAAERRERYVDQLNDLMTVQRHAEMIIMMSECRNFGRSRGWLHSCAWFEGERDHAAATEGMHTAEENNNHDRWLAVQSLIWFSREV
jgi:hypothetical protein